MIVNIKIVLSLFLAKISLFSGNGSFTVNYFTLTCDLFLYSFFSFSFVYFNSPANTIEERNNWVHKLEDAIEKAHTNLSTIQLQNSQNQYSRLRPLIKRNTATIENFNHRLSEADAYLQLLIDQCRCLDESIQACQDESKKNKLINVKNHSQNLLDSYKHTIVLIQLAKVSFTCSFSLPFL